MENSEEKRPKFVLHFVGYSCTGKTTLEKALKEKITGSYTVAYDKMKWQLAGYNRDKDIQLIKDITKGLYEVVCKTGSSILLLTPISTEEEYISHKQIANQYGYRFISIQLTAPMDILLARFRERVEKAKLMASKTISVTDENIFLNNLTRPFFIPKEIISFDTSIIKTEDIVNRILELIK